MQLPNSKKLHVVAGRATQDLAASICDELGVDLGSPNIAEFANGEIHVKYGESIRGSDVFIVQTHANWADGSINDSIMEHLIMVDAAKRASAKRITAVAPFYGYSRQDRKASGREPITARLIADLFHAAGADRLISVDLHSGQIQGFFDGPVDHLTAMTVLIDYLRELDNEDLVIVSPDAGRMKVAERYTNLLDADIAYVHKRRSTEEKNAVEAKEIIGHVEGRTCVLIDDMIDTGGTICAAAELLADHNAAKVIIATTHGVFSGPALERLASAPVEMVLVTDTVPLADSQKLDKIEVLTVAPVIARAIAAVFKDTSVSEIFQGHHLA